MKGYELIMADPPWNEVGGGVKGGVRGANRHYGLMSTKEIISLGDEVQAVADDNSFLFLWATANHLIDALKVMEAWGFDYRTNMVWVKNQIGLGHYFRMKHELLLVGVRGKPEYSRRPHGTGSTAGRKVHQSVLEAPKTVHSAKPDQIYEWAETFAKGPKLEIFARRRHEGWDAWGDEVGVVLGDKPDATPPPPPPPPPPGGYLRPGYTEQAFKK